MSSLAAVSTSWHAQQRELTAGYRQYGSGRGLTAIEPREFAAGVEASYLTLARFLASRSFMWLASRS